MSPQDWAGTGIGFQERTTMALESIAKSLEKIANPPQVVMQPPPDTAWVMRRDPKVVAEENKRASLS